MLVVIELLLKQVFPTLGVLFRARWKAVCIDRFGLSAPGNTVMNELGISLENLKSIASDLV